MSLGSYSSAAFTVASGVAVAANADITVRNEFNGALASIFSDRAGTTPIAQPGFQADANGRFVFYAAGLEQGYEVTVTKGAESHTLNNIAIGLGQEFDIDEFWRNVLAAATKQTAREGLGVMGAAAAAKIPVGDGADFRALAALGGQALLNGYLDWTVSGNVLTIAVKTAAGADPSAADPVYFAVRDATAANGGITWVPVTTALSLSINDTATLGTANSTPFRLWAVGFLDGATPRLGVINCLAGTAPNFSIYPLGAWGIASATLEDNASDSAHVFYADAAVSAKAYATLGYATWESGLATAGTWSAGPTRKQLFGPGVPLPGWRVQMVREQTGAVATGTTQIPEDDSIPTSSEGDEYIDVDITPTSAANVLRAEFHAIMAHNSVTGGGGMAVILDGTTTIGVSRNRKDAANAQNSATVTGSVLAGTTSTKTFNGRVGYGSAGTTTFNGSAGARLYGGAAASYMECEEVMV